MITAHDIVSEARTWVGVPFRHQGRTRRGVDCVGLVIVVAQELRVLPSTFIRNDYGRNPSRQELDEKIAAHCTRIDEPEPGCLLAIRWNRELSHVAFFTGDTMIHSYERVGKVTEHGFRAPWPRLVDSVWWLPGVDR